MYVSSTHKDWDEAIDFVTFYYNTRRQESTGFSPFYIVYGREPLLSIDVALEKNQNPIEAKQKEENYVQKFITRLSAARKLVKKRLAVAQTRQKKHYDKRHRSASFQIGDEVLIFKPIRKIGKSEKTPSSLPRTIQSCRKARSSKFQSNEFTP